MKSFFQDTFISLAVRCALLLGLAALVHGCATPSPLPASMEPPSNEVVISYQRFYKRGGERFAELTVSNALPHSIWVAAYGSHDPIVQSRYWIRDHWATQGPIVCEFSVKARELPTHGRFTFSIPVDNLLPIPVRLGVSCSRSAEQWSQDMGDYWVDLPRHW